ncbi:MAG: hypothetical protein AAGN46_04115, partial [Acidobacteriota bacterium]
MVGARAAGGEATGGDATGGGADGRGAGGCIGCVAPAVGGPTGGEEGAGPRCGATTVAAVPGGGG